MIDLLEENRLITELQQSKLSLQRIKAGQFIGPDSLSIRNNVSVNEYDAYVSVYYLEVSKFTIVFTADIQEYPFTSLKIRIWQTTDGPVDLIPFNIQQKISTNPKAIEWRVTARPYNPFSGNNYKDTYLKVEVQSTDTGAITAAGSSIPT